MLSEGTIIALSTASGAAAIAVIRVSGDAAISTTDRLFCARSKKKLVDQKSHSIHLGELLDGDRIIDEVLVSVFKNPHSYTGEDVIEISCHGSRYIQEKILQLIESAAKGENEEALVKQMKAIVPEYKSMNSSYTSLDK